jgi:hypothetical protein
MCLRFRCPAPDCKSSRCSRWSYLRSIARIRARSSISRDVVEYADIAVDLEVYGFAALLYWEATTVASSAGRDVVGLVESRLFCLDQLGIKDLKLNFKGDHAAAFARIKAHRQKLMEQSPMFKAVREPAAEK